MDKPKAPFWAKSEFWVLIALMVLVGLSGTPWIDITPDIMIGLFTIVTAYIGHRTAAKASEPKQPVVPAAEQPKE